MYLITQKWQGSQELPSSPTPNRGSSQKALKIITMKSHNSITSLVKPAQAILSHYARPTTRRRGNPNRAKDTGQIPGYGWQDNRELQWKFYQSNRNFRVLISTESAILKYTIYYYDSTHYIDFIYRPPTLAKKMPLNSQPIEGTTLFGGRRNPSDLCLA